MNKSILSFMCVGLCAVACAEETAFVGQAMRAIEIRSDRTNLMVSVAFNELSPVDGKPLTAANIVSTKNLSVGDQIHIYTGSRYFTWTLNEDYEWEAPTTALLASGDGQSTLDTPAANEAGSPVGSGFWLIRKNPSKDKPIYIFGAVVNVNNTTIAVGKNLLGNPLSDDATPTFATANKGDKIGIFAVDGASLAEYEYNGTNWGYWGKSDSSPYLPTFKTVNLVVRKGEGFWYNNRGTSVITVSWTPSAN